MEQEKLEQLLKDCKLYLRIDYEDDEELLKLIIETAVEDVKDLTGADPSNLTPRQKMLVLAITKQLYDNRELYQKEEQRMATAISSMLLKEMYGG
jgi:uncharacterized phage protein (predicted DNA packaging)